MGERPTNPNKVPIETAVQISRNIARDLQTDKEISQEDFLDFFKDGRGAAELLHLVLIVEQLGVCKTGYENPNNSIHPSIFSGTYGEKADYFMASLYPAKPAVEEDRAKHRPATPAQPETLRLFAKGREQFGVAIPLTAERRLDEKAFLKSAYAQSPTESMRDISRAADRIADALEGPVEALPILDVEPDSPELIAA